MTWHSRWSTASGAVTALVASVALVVGLAPAARASDLVGASRTMSRTWGVDGHVAAIAPAGPVTIVAGGFGTVLGPAGDSRAVGNVAKFRPSTGTFDNWPVTVDGPVDAVAVDGGTVYLAGDFRHVNGQRRISLAAVSLADGTLLPWSPQANVSVDAVAVGGGYVYVGGAFDTVTDASGDVAAPHLARVGAVDGTVDRAWSQGVAIDGTVRSLLLAADGSAVYVGGDFGAVAGQGSASRLTLLSTGSSPDLVAGFVAGPNNGAYRAPVFALALDGGDLLVGAGGAGGGCTLEDATTGATVWSHHTTGNVVAVAFLGPMSYCGGHFSGSASIDDLSRYKLAEVVTATGDITSFKPRVNSALGVFALASSATALFAGGDFTKVGGVAQPHLGMFVDGSALQPPAPPKNVEARAGDGQVVLIWDRPDTDGGAKIRKFKVYRALGSGRLTLLAKTASTSYVDTDVVNGVPGQPSQTYSYAVRAVSSVGASSPSDTVQAVPQAGLVIAPSAPVDVTANGTLGAAKLAWAPPVTDGGSPVTGYTVLRGTTSGVLSPLAGLSADARSYSDTEVTVGQRYYYAIEAVNEVGAGSPSKQVSASPNTGVPGAPTLSASAADGGAGFLLEWQPSASAGAGPVTAYVLVRDGVRVYRGGATVLEFTDTGVAPGTTYVYKVRAVNAYGSSPWSDAVSVTAP